MTGCGVKLLDGRNRNFLKLGVIFGGVSREVVLNPGRVGEDIPLKVIDVMFEQDGRSIKL